MTIVINGAQTTLSEETDDSILEFTALDVVKDSLQDLRVIDGELPLGDYERQVGFDKLNQLVKNLQNKGFHLWTEVEGILPLIEGKEKYILGPNGDDCADADDFRFLTVDQTSSNKTLYVTGDINPAPELIKFDPANSIQDWIPVDATLTSDGSALTITNTSTSKGSASYSVPTTVGNTYIFTFTYTKGTSLSATVSAIDIDGTIATLPLSVNATSTLTFVARQRDTSFEIENTSLTIGHTSIINTLNYVDNAQGDRVGIFSNNKNLQWNNAVFFSKNKVTLGSKLLDSASKGNKIYAYSKIIPRPMSIINIRFRENKGFSEIPTTKWSRTEYFEQPDKTNKGTLTKWYYTPTLKDGGLYVWSTAASNEQLAYFTYVRPTKITNENADKIDFPSEWFIPISAMLTKLLMRKFPAKPERAVQIKLASDEAEDEILGFDNEDSSIKFTVDHIGR